jgi:hypothetical protein
MNMGKLANIFKPELASPGGQGYSVKRSYRKDLMQTSAQRLRTRSSCLLLIFMAAVVLAMAAPAGPTQRPAQPQENSGELSRLLTARYETARRLLEIEEALLKDGRATLFTICEAARRVRDSALELSSGAEARRAALTNYLAVTRRLEESVSRVVESGRAPTSDKELALYLRLDAEIALLRDH